MKQREEKKILSKEDRKKVQYDLSSCRIHSVDGALIDVNETEARILFFNAPLLDAPGDSIVCQCPIEIRMNKTVLLDLVEDLTIKTVAALMESKIQETEKYPKRRPPEEMFA